MRYAILRLGSASVLAVVLAACGGGSDPAPAPVVAPPAATLKENIAAAAAVAANDSASNSSAPFMVLQAGGVPAVTVNSAPKVNFTVFSDGAVKTGLTIGNVSLAIAKLVPASNGNPDEWKNYTHRLRTPATASATGVYTDAVRATLVTPAFTSASPALQATTDPKPAGANQLVFNADGYYTYTFTTDITNPAWTTVVNGVTYKTNGVAFERGLTHRVAIQLSYVNAAGETVRVNPYFDFTVDASGNAVPVTDATKTRKMTDISSCNSCHEKLALHGGGRVDTQFCVMCHNPTTVDANSGNNLALATMVHKIHAAKLLASKAASGGGEHFTVRTDDFSEVGFPQDLRNCTKCHSGSNPATPQGDNWKTVPSKAACLTCHANKTGSEWDTSHQVFARDVGVWAGATPQSLAKDLPNSACAACHKPGSNIAPERVHWNQNEENAGKYKMNIESASFNDTANHTGRTVTVKYFLSDPTSGNAAYNLVTPDCTGSTTITCANTTKFGNLRFYLAYQNLVGQSTSVTEFTSYNNGGSGANVFAYKGANDGSNHYSVNIPLPDDTATSVAAGTARVISIGQVKEPKLQVKWATDPRPEAVPASLVNVVVQNAHTELALSGTLTPRRSVVATDKCNACHGALGTTSGSNTLSEAFHGGARNRVEACVMCHDVNRASSNIMTNGLALIESYQFKRLIHGIHGNSKRTYPFTHGNKVVGSFSKEGLLLSSGTGALVSSTSATAPVSAPAGTPFEPWLNGTIFAVGTPFATGVENYAAEVSWPGRTANSPVGINCNVCHVDNSYKVDRGPLGAVVAKPILAATLKADPNPMNWMVISPKAASCTACHDSPKAIAHVTSFGNASFGNRTQTQSVQTQEICADCHSSGGFKGVDIVHGQK